MGGVWTQGTSRVYGAWLDNGGAQQAWASRSRIPSSHEGSFDKDQTALNEKMGMNTRKIDDSVSAHNMLRLKTQVTYREKLRHKEACLLKGIEL